MGGPTTFKLFQVDSFSSKAFGGNPAAVLLIDESAQIDDKTRQKLAAETNIAETAFIEKHSESIHGCDLFRESADFSLRWFTPEFEVPLCGHATIAAAAVLFSECGNTNPAIRFHTLSGILTVKRRSALEYPTPSTTASITVSADENNSTAAAAACADGGVLGDRPPLMLEMSLPLADPLDTVPKGCADPVLLATCVGSSKVLEVRYTGANLKYLLVVLDDSTTRAGLEGIRPDLRAMSKGFANKDVHAVLVTTQGGSSPGGYDFLSRFFAPWMGIDEDHVTASAHTVLGPYWQARLGKDIMLARQCSSRGGDLTVQIDRGSGRALISGTAFIVIRGTICV